MTAVWALGLFALTAVAEIVGCWLILQAVSGAKPGWYWLPGACSLLLFAWLLSFHPVASGRVYAAYGGVYVLTALVWLRIVDGIRPVLADYLGAGLILLGALIIVAHHWPRLEPH